MSDAPRRQMIDVRIRALIIGMLIGAPLFILGGCILFAIIDWGY